MLIVCQNLIWLLESLELSYSKFFCCDSFLQSSLLLLQLPCCHTRPLPHHHYHTSPALLRLFMNSTTIIFITEFVQTMLFRRQTSPPCCSTGLPSNCLTQVQGAQAAGQAASQHARPDVFPLASPCTNVALSSSTCLTRSSSKAIATMFPNAVATTLPDSADANVGGLTSIPEVPGRSEMPTLTLISDLPGTSEMPAASKNCQGLWQNFCPS
jgi:hypothetical protein